MQGLRRHHGRGWFARHVDGIGCTDEAGGQGMVSGIGARIRALRQQRAMTQREFAGLVGIHHTYLSKLENERVDTRP